MSNVSMATARIMETWAHGLDLAETFGITREPTSRLRHIAHLGHRTLGWSFMVNGRPMPTVPCRLELSGPDEALWTWGPADARERVTGPAEDFCLVVVQRRAPSEVALTVTGAEAARWLNIAQAFAGPPRPARRDSGPNPPERRGQG